MTAPADDLAAAIAECEREWPEHGWVLERSFTRPITYHAWLSARPPGPDCPGEGSTPAAALRAAMERARRTGARPVTQEDGA